ncbi:DNA/RNA polymerases superfamily protein [Striga asiatica]|uniref:DNA/RNA polymerases superfamily protein n=1 Tax=Striga asiatica TaxID=4170 RepID=A0A5A7PIC9_STRAF|nr:DNA/RNA polymerases superfamily protein [Striga asiatica]
MGAKAESGVAVAVEEIEGSGVGLVAVVAVEEEVVVVVAVETPRQRTGKGSLSEEAALATQARSRKPPEPHPIPSHRASPRPKSTAAPRWSTIEKLRQGSTRRLEKTNIGEDVFGLVQSLRLSFDLCSSPPSSQSSPAAATGFRGHTSHPIASPTSNVPDFNSHPLHRRQCPNLPSPS